MKVIDDEDDFDDDDDKKKKRNLPQMMDQVMTINSVQKSSKLELSSGTFGRSKFRYSSHLFFVQSIEKS